MEWLEADPLPKECEACKEEECYHCDIAGQRWFLSRKDNLYLSRQLKMQAIRRLQQQIEEINRELEVLGNSKANY